MPTVCGGSSGTDGAIDIESLSFFSWRKLSALQKNKGEDTSSLGAGLINSVTSALVASLNSTIAAAGGGVASGLSLNFKSGVLVAPDEYSVGVAGTPRGVVVHQSDYSVRGVRRLRINSIEFYAGAAVNTPVNVNIQSGSALKIVQLNGLALGRNAVPVGGGFYAQSSHVSVTIDGGVVAQETTAICSNCLNSSNNCGTSIGTTGLKRGHGFIVDYTCGCNFAGLICGLVNSGALDAAIVEQLRYQFSRLEDDTVQVNPITMVGGATRRGSGERYETAIKHLAPIIKNALKSLPSGDGCTNCGIRFGTNFI